MIVTAWSQGRGLQRYLWFHRRGPRSHWICPSALSERTKSSNMRLGRLHHAEVQMVTVEESRIPEQQKARSGDKSHLHSLAICVWSTPSTPDETDYLVKVGWTFKQQTDIRLWRAVAEEHFREFLEYRTLRKAERWQCWIEKAKSDQMGGRDIDRRRQESRRIGN